MPGDENAGSAIYQRQLAILQQKAASNYRPLSISQHVTNENKTLDSNVNDCNDNVEDVGICIETDIAIPVDKEEVSGVLTDDTLPISCLKRMVDHYKKLVCQTQEEIDIKKETILDLESQLQDVKNARDEFLIELEAVLDEGEDSSSHDNINSEVESSRRPDDERTDEE